MVGAPSGLVQRHRRRPAMGLGFRRVAAAVSSRGACGVRRTEPCMGATRNPRPARRARCPGSRPGSRGVQPGARVRLHAGQDGGRAARARGRLHAGRLTPRPAAIALVLPLKNV